MSFAPLELCDPLLKALDELEYRTPTDIQSRAIPEILAGKDLIAAAQTGTGKTASFVLPMLEQLQPPQNVRAKRCRALILAPTRELALQVGEQVKRYSKYLELSCLVAHGGVKIEPQQQRLLEGVDILVATPGRLLDLAYQRSLQLDEVQTLVLDEADCMLDMGFMDDLQRILQRLPAQRQNLLFSATLTERVRDLAKTFLQQPTEILIAPHVKTAPSVTQWLVTVDKSNKSSLLSHLIQEHQWQQALIFIRTKHGADKLVSQLGKRGIAAEAFHGDKAQGDRTRILGKFKTGKTQFLVATDLAARGLDIDQLPLVINYDLPRDTDDYVHRIGRTGRAGSSGEAVALVSFDDFKNLCAIESRLGHLIERRDLEAFTPKKTVPISILNYTPKNKNQKGGHPKRKK